jgi:hypothetical protein
LKYPLWVVISLGCVLALLLGSVLPAQAQAAVVRAVLFYSPSCAHCHKVMTEDLPPLFEKYGEQLLVIAIDVSQQGGQALYQAAIQRFKIAPELRGVPMLIVGDVVLVGSLEIPQQFPVLIVKYLASGGTNWPDIPGLSSIVPTSPPTAVPTMAPTPQTAAPQAPVKTQYTLDLPVLGQVDLDAHSLAFSTAIIGLVDGFNPCSLWVISLLLALVINTGSRKKALTVGLTYLVVAAGLYGLIMVGLFSAFAVIGYALWIRIAVALIALTFAVVNIKDYFWFKAGASFTISDEHKPGIYRNIRNILSPGKSGLALVGATAAMAGGITLIEMPCTAGLPILWTKLITANNVGGIEFGLLLGLYLLLFMLDEMAVFISAVVTLKATRLEEKEGRILKLVGGVVMLALAVVLLIDPTLMDSVRNSLLIFGAAFALAAMILLVHRLVLPRYGIIVGTEALTGKKPLERSE